MSVKIEASGSSKRTLAARAVFSLVALPFLVALGCSTDAADDTTGDGGTTSSGGSAGGAAKGGTSSTGGAGTGGTAVGGTGATGGTGTAGAGTGGSSTGGASTGGAATGGAATGGAATGGAAAGGASTGGAATGGASTGGVSAGGTSNGGAMSGGAPHGGAGSSGGASMGGMSGSGAGGAPGSGSPGCGSASPLKTGNFTESVGGTSRKWMLDVPSNYDASKPYRLIFVWHPLGGSGSQVVNGGYNGLKSLSNGTTIFATADGLNGSNSEASGTGWWNANGGDMKLVQIMLDKINAGLCVDQQRIFSTGFSFGGMMSYTLPFEFDVFRAVAPCSGKDGVIPHEKKYDRPIPIMAFHGNNDTFVLTSLGKAFFDQYRTGRNQCGSQTQPTDPSPCVQYQGCQATSIWCEFSGAHETWSQEPQAIWKFFSQF